MKRQLSIPASLSELGSLRDEIFEFIGTELNETDRSRVILALDEAVTNVIVHGYGNDQSKKVDIEMESDLRSFIFVISDSAREYNPLKNLPVEQEIFDRAGQIGGLGIYIYSRIMKTDYEYNPGIGNRLTLIKEKL